MTANRTPLLFVCFAVTILSVAVAQDVARAQDATEEQQKQASQRDEAARTAFRLGEFDKAIDEWKEAYRLVSHPVFLYNIAQAYRRKENFAQSMFFYKQYLQEAPDATNRAEVEKRIAELEALIEKNKAATSAKPDDPLNADGDATSSGSDTSTTGSDTASSPSEPGVPNTESSGAVTPPVDDGSIGRDDGAARPGRTLKLTGLGVGGAGVALIGTGIVFALKASSAQSDIEDAVANGEPWTDELQDKDDSGKSNATLSKVTIGLGVAAVATGTTLYILGMQKDKRAEGVSVLPIVGPETAGVALELRY
jgi:tetratricopeptide (TPR) repeat protein